MTRPFIIVNEPLAEADDFVNLITEIAIKLDDALVASSHLKVDFGTSQLKEERLGPLHHLSAVSPSLVIRVHGKVIDPAPMAFVSGHHGGDDSFIAGADLNPNEEELGVHLKLALDVFNWIVPGAD